MKFYIILIQPGGYVNGWTAIDPADLLPENMDLKYDAPANIISRNIMDAVKADL